MAQYWGTGRLGAHQSVAFTGTAGTITNPMSAGVHKCRVVATSACYIRIGSSPTATVSDPYLPANVVEYFTINPGEQVSAIQVSAGGSLSVTEIP